jgi:uncharacterized coiled-coil protein SlyX
MIKQHLENSITAIENEKSIAIQEAKVTAMNEKIAPFNADIDNAYQNALEELSLKFENDKKSLLEAGEKKKLKNQETIINEVVNAVSYKYDLAIAKIKKQIEETG